MEALFTLIAQSGPEAGRRIAIPAQGLVVGRAEDLDGLVLPEPEVSRHHARLRLTPAGALQLEDASINGTYLNGQRAPHAAQLQMGDRVQFGSLQAPVFQVRLQGAAAAAAGARPGVASGPAAGTLRVQAETAGPGCWLELVERSVVTPVELSGRLVLGRQSGEGRLAIAHASVSAQHCEITRVGATAHLRDLGSRNGTFVNQERVSDVVLAEGDLIQLGSCESHLLLFREAARRPLLLEALDVSAPHVTLGRGEANDIRLDHPTVSLLHAAIRNHAGRTTITDQNSTNGTFVNGQPATRATPLRSGDQVHFGALEFSFDGTHLEGAGAGGTRLCASTLRVEVRDRSRAGTRLLLDDVSLVIEPRQFVGLLGGSGAGKSTLMDALNGSRPAQQGNVWLNQASLYANYAALRALIGYVPQDDILHAELTTRDCLYYSARLRLPDDYGEPALRRRVQEVIATLELDAQADQTIRSLSGGQRKRVSVGVELLSNPGLLFLDEPTAGQDPKNEQQMMQLFRRLANRGASVVINTHLLGSFGLLDRVAVLVGGKLAYFGPAPEMLSYFDCQQPQEVYYRLKDGATPEQWAERYRRSPQYSAYALGALDAADAAGTRAEAPAPASKPKHGRLRQTATLLSRQWNRKRKDWGNLAALLLPPSVIAGLIGLMNWPHGAVGARRLFTPDTPMSLFMVVLIALWFGCSATVREIVDEAAVYRRERQRDLNLSSYISSKVAYLILLAGAQSGLCIVVMLLLHVIAGHGLAAWGWMWLLTIQGGLVGLLISALASSAEQALYAFPLVMIAELLFAGLLVPTAPLRPFYLEMPAGSNGQIASLVLHDQPGWLPLVPPMPPRLRASMAAVMVSRWGLEGLANLYSMDLGQLPACLDAQQSGTQANFCGYSLALTDLVAFTFRPTANGDARAYTAALARLSDPDAGGDLPQLPANHAETDYLAVQILMALLMVAALAAAMRWKERSRHATGNRAG